MNKKFGSKLNNKGSGIVTVMVAVVFLTILGSMLLMYSLTNFEMKATDRKGKQNSYDAETCMDEVAAGLQNLASDATDESLKTVLMEFGSKSEGKVQAQFAEKYLDRIGKWSINGTSGTVASANGEESSSSSNIKIIKTLPSAPSSETTGTKFTSNGEYNILTIGSLLKNTRNEGTVIVNTYGETDKYVSYSFQNENPEDNDYHTTYFYQIHYSPIFKQPVCTAEYEKVNLNGSENPDTWVFKGITFKDVSITYVKESFSNTVSTDVFVSVPNVGYEISGLSTSDVKKYALIVGGKLISSVGDVKIQGSTYASGIETSLIGNVVFDNKVNDRSYDVIVRDGITIQSAGLASDKDSFKTETKVTLWAGNIEIKTAASVSLNYITKVANDLMLNGSNSKATVGGEYFGFGPSEKDPETSSAILINGKHSTLNFDNTDLKLTGFAFVADPNATNNILTGESGSVKENQRIYLIDEDYIEYKPVGNTGYATLDQNPKRYDDDESKHDSFFNVRLKDDVTWKGIDEDGKEKDMTFADYNAVVTTVLNADKSYIYYFISFRDKKDADNNIITSAGDYANRYFRDFYNNHKKDIQKYINKYVDITGNLHTNENSGNYLIRYDSKVNGEEVSSYKLLELLSATDKSALQSEGRARQIEFENYCHYLSSVAPDGEESQRHGSFDENLRKWEEDKKLNPTSFTLKEPTPYEYFVDYKKIHDEFKGTNSSAVVKSYTELNGGNDDLCYALIIDNMDDSGTLGTYEIQFNDGKITFNNKAINGNNGNHSFKNIGIIICNGNLNLKGTGTFEGMIMCAGDLSVDGGITIKNVDSTVSKIGKAYNSFLYNSSDVNLALKNYLYVALSTTVTSDGASESSSTNILSLVKFKNWKKN